MELTTFFQYHLPATNHITGKPDHFIDVIAKFDTEMNHVSIQPMLGKIDLYVILNGSKVVNEMQSIAEKHFACHPENGSKVIGDLVVNESGVIAKEVL